MESECNFEIRFSVAYFLIDYALNLTVSLTTYSWGMIFSTWVTPHDAIHPSELFPIFWSKMTALIPFYPVG